MTRHGPRLSYATFSDRYKLDQDEIGARLGVRVNVRRWAVEGVTLFDADRLATMVGEHASAIWGGGWDEGWESQAEWGLDSKQRKKERNKARYRERKSAAAAAAVPRAVPGLGGHALPARDDDPGDDRLAGVNGVPVVTQATERHQVGGTQDCCPVVRFGAACACSGQPFVNVSGFLRLAALTRRIRLELETADTSAGTG